MPNEAVAALGEHALIERIRRRLPPAPRGSPSIIGDDAAVFEPVRNRLSVITTDAVVDGIHVDRRFVPAEAIGHRVVAVNLSDLAAMGAEPQLLTLSLALPDDVTLGEFDALVDGALAMAERGRARLVGGNITRTRGPLVAEVTALGRSIAVGFFAVSGRGRAITSSSAAHWATPELAWLCWLIRVGMRALVAGRRGTLPAPGARLQLGLCSAGRARRRLRST